MSDPDVAGAENINSPPLPFLGMDATPRRRPNHDPRPPRRPFDRRRHLRLVGRGVSLGRVRRRATGALGDQRRHGAHERRLPLAGAWADTVTLTGTPRRHAMTDHSPTSVEDWVRCPTFWWWRHERRWVPKSIGTNDLAAWFGRAIDRGGKALYAGPAGGTGHAIEELTQG